MTGSTRETLKKILWVVLGVVIIIVLAYFVKTYVALNSKNIPQTYFADKIFGTSDYNLQYTFSEDAESVVRYEDNDKISYIVELKDNIFYLSNDENSFNIIILNKTTLFCSDGNYLYLYD